MNQLIPILRELEIVSNRLMYKIDPYIIEKNKKKWDWDQDKEDLGEDGADYYAILRWFIDGENIKDVFSIYDLERWVKKENEEEGSEYTLQNLLEFGYHLDL